VRKKLEPSSPTKDRPAFSEEQRKERLEYHTASLKRLLEHQREAKQGMLKSFAAREKSERRIHELVTKAGYQLVERPQ
jgi:hypothetical protein